MLDVMQPEIIQVFESYPKEYSEPLMQLRTFIFETAEETPGVGELEETLKWGQPSYLTHQTKSGSTVRIDRFGENQIAIFFHCNTTLVDTFKTIFPETFEFSKNRAIVLDPFKPLPETEIKVCLEMALMYHRNKNII